MKKIILDNETIKVLEKITRDYMLSSRVSSVFLINTAGQMLYHRGISKSDYFIQSIGALTAGIFNATNAIAKLLNEDYFDSAFQEGKKFSFYYYAVTDELVLVSLYDKNAIIGVVQVMTKKTGDEIKKLLKEEKNDSFLGDDFKTGVEAIIDDMFE